MTLKYQSDYAKSKILNVSNKSLQEKIVTSK
jgi:hypothetical protein